MQVVCYKQVRPLAVTGVLRLHIAAYIIPLRNFVRVQFQLQHLLPGSQLRKSNTMSDSDSDKSNGKAGHNEEKSDFTK